jgi:spore coat protein U-like protein
VRKWKHVPGAALLAVLSFAVCTVGAFAKSRTAAVGVSAKVSADCVVNSPLALDLGTYGAANVKGKALVSNGRVLSIACTRGAAGVRIALNNGTHFSNANRHVLGPKSKKVAYQIYTTKSLKTVWNATNTVAYAPKSDDATAIALYSKVPGGQKPPAGQYSDTLTATVDF